MGPSVLNEVLVAASVVLGATSVVLMGVALYRKFLSTFWLEAQACSVGGLAGFGKDLRRRLAVANRRFVSASYRERVGKSLVKAGEPREWQAEDIVSLQEMGLVVGALLGAWASAVFGTPAVVCVMLAMVGAFYPLIWIRDQIKRRHIRILRALPYSLDLLTLSVEAGLDFVGALQKVNEKGKRGPLRDEFQLTLKQLKMGTSRDEALKALIGRVDLPALTTIVHSLIHANKTGTSLGRVLRIQSSQLRTERTQRAEKLANEASVKMLFPLVTCIFPTIFMILFGPVVFAFLSGKLMCLAGPAGRTQFVLSGTEEIVIGRSAENGICIPDNSVSRRHIALRQRGKDWWVRDLGSGNGTALNGERIREEKRCRDGDVLLLGETRLEFIDPKEPRTLVDRFWQGRRRALFGAAACVAVAASLIAVYRFRRGQMERVNEQAIVTAHRQVEEAFQLGKTLVREGNWAAAKLKFQQVAQRNANFPQLQEYLHRTELEVVNQEALSSAEAALNANQLADALAALAKVSADTFQDAKLEQLRIVVANKLKERLVDAHSAFDAHDYEEAARLTEEVLRAAPNDREAQELSQVVDQATANLAKQIRAQEKRPGPLPKGTSEFLDGDIPAARANLERCAARRIGRCQKVLNEVKKFDELRRRMDYLDAEGLKKMIRLDSEITRGGTSWWGRKAKSRLGQVWLKAAGSAVAAQHWGKSAKLANDVLQVDPGNREAAAILRDLKNKAMDLYLGAYTVRDSEPEAALAKFQEVLQMTSIGDEIHQRAKSWVEKLSK